MTAYGIPYTVNGWGDEVVTTVEAGDPRDLGSVCTAVVRGTGPGPVILVPTVALTAVDTTPPEPEPGAWLIGETLCWRDSMHTDGSPDDDRWRVDHRTIGGWWTWPTVWKHLGGPGITPRRLVPEVAAVDVDLPWQLSSGPTSQRPWCVEVEWTLTGYVLVSASVMIRGAGVRLAPDAAEAMAAALLTAARAARGATP